MTKLEKIWTQECIGRTEIRIDWDNDRHQAIAMEKTDPESVRAALLRAAHLLGQEIGAGVLRSWSATA